MVYFVAFVCYVLKIGIHGPDHGSILLAKISTDIGYFTKTYLPSPHPLK